MKELPKPGTPTLDDLVFAPIDEETLREHLAQIVHAESLKDLTPKQRKKHASKPMYLVRYE